MQKGNDVRWAGQSDFIPDDDSWMDNLFLFEGNILERPYDLATELGVKHNNLSGYSDVEKYQDEASGKRQPLLHSTDVDRRHQSGERNVGRDRRNPLLTADEGTQNDKLPFRTQYVNVMFSSFSIRGWGHDASSCLPCHYMHLIKEPT